MRILLPGYPAQSGIPAEEGALASGERSRRFFRFAPALLLRDGSRHNWEQLVRFCVVGASGYAVNLWVFSTLVLGEVVFGPFTVASLGFEAHYIPAAVCSFLVAVTNNYTWNRLWTFRDQRGHVAYQGLRFLIVSTLALCANLVVLHTLVTLGLTEVVAQAIAIVLVTPVNFVGNKLWSFGPRS